MKTTYIKLLDKFSALLAIICFIAILYFVTLFLLKQTSANCFIDYLFLGIGSIIISFFLVLIIFMFIPFFFEYISLSLERKYYKANIISSKMKALKDEQDILSYKISTSNNIIIRNNLITEFNEIGNKINKITNPKSMISDDVKIAFYTFGFFFFFLMLIYTEPKELILLNNEASQWLLFFAILIANITIFTYTITKPIKSLKNLSIWICIIIVLALILFFTKPYFITVLSTMEIFWYVGCCLLISALSIVIYKGLE